MKTLIITAIAICFASSTYAGCGVKVDVKGKLKSYDAEKKELTITQKKEDKIVTLEATAVIKNAEGAEATIEDLVGKRVNVSTDKHTKKAEAISGLAKKKKKEAA